MNRNELASVAQQLVAPGKGILAADESTGTIAKRLQTIHTESTEENRRAYRELLFTAPGMEKFISGVILYDETLRQSTKENTSFSQLLLDKGVCPGIKVDTGAKNLAGFPNEKITDGLDGLRDRFAEYYKLGAKFAKWRAVITIGKGIPSKTCIDANAQMLARYAALSQEANIVPIVEPEVLMDGPHDIETCEAVTETALRSLFNRLLDHNVYLEGILLKPNMVLPGTLSDTEAGNEEVAARTLKVFKNTVPASVPGIVFLSGGQSSVLATQNLNAMNQVKDLPWRLSFSYGRALQEDALKTWGGNSENVKAAQSVFYKRAMLNGHATNGTYTQEMENNPL